MITRIEIDGFKSLRGFAADLEPLTVLVGPNSAGKSNVLEAMGLLSRLARLPVVEAFKQGRGRALDQFTRTGGEPGRRMSFAVELLLPAGRDVGGKPIPGRCRYELVIERRSRPSGADELAITHEGLWTMARAGDRWLDAHPELAGGGDEVVESCSIFQQIGEDERERQITLDELVRDVPRVHADFFCPRGYTLFAAKRDRAASRVLSIHGEGMSEALDILKETLGLPDIDSARKYVMREGQVRARTQDSKRTVTAEKLAGDVFSAFRLLQPDLGAQRGPSERIGADTLAPDASNLSTVLADLSNAMVAEIRADIVSLVPGISSFEVVPEGEQLRIDFELSGGERMPARLVSDGTLRLLALLTALRVEPRPSILAIEEPENGIYPGRLRRLLELLEETLTLPDDDATESEDEPRPARLPTQLLITTHSPVVLAAFRSKPQHLRYIDLVRRDSKLVTRARPVAVEPDAECGRATVSLREIDELLQAADSEIASNG